MSEEAQLKREGTMVATAQEGKEFLQSKGMTVTDDDVKTRGQKERLEQISTAPADSNGCQEPAAVEEDKPSMKKEGTMAVTAREGAELLGGEELGRTRGETAQINEEEEGEATTPTKVKRTTTMAQTAEDGQQILGDEELGKTRAQTQRLSESDDKKPAVKRTSTMAQTKKEGEEFLEREAMAKRSKETKEDENGTDEPKKVDQVQDQPADVQMSEA